MLSAHIKEGDPDPQQNRAMMQDMQHKMIQRTASKSKVLLSMGIHLPDGADDINLRTTTGKKNITNWFLAFTCLICLHGRWPFTI